MKSKPNYGEIALIINRSGIEVHVRHRGYGIYNAFVPSGGVSGATPLTRDQRLLLKIAKDAVEELKVFLKSPKFKNVSGPTGFQG
jgi:hypothetical protein